MLFDSFLIRLNSIYVKLKINCLESIKYIKSTEKNIKYESIEANNVYFCKYFIKSSV